MAFDLNKNDGSNNGSSDKNTTSSKFDLSKGETETTSKTIINPAPKSNTWIIALVGILIVGAGIWYYSSHTKTAVVAHTASIEVAPVDTTIAVPLTAQEVAKISATEDVAAVPAAAGNEVLAKLNNKIPATFNQGSSSINRIDQLLIKRIISYLTKNPDASIQVNGYASSDGSLEINQIVSQARADAFKKYLVAQNVAEDKIVAIGKGIENPIVSNDSDAGRKKNRRVEITFP